MSFALGLVLGVVVGVPLVLLGSLYLGKLLAGHERAPRRAGSRAASVLHMPEDTKATGTGGFGRRRKT